MEMVIAILLWIGVVQPGNVYTQQEYDALVSANEPVINSVLADPMQQEMVWATIGTNEPDVIVGEGE